MTFLGPQSDRAVRTAVEAYMDGRLRPEVDGEAVFETRNSRYRLMDGTLFSATDSSLVGAELVGWLTESADNCQVSAWWRPGARAVLVDRRAGRHIVVTSATRLLKVDNASPAGSARARGGSVPGQARSVVTPHTPGPPQAIPPCPPLPVHQVQPQSVRPSSRVEPLPNAQPMPVPPAPPVPHLETAPATRPPPVASPRPARAPVHPPPRPIARPPSSAPPPARPLPMPAPPPRQGPLPRFETSGRDAGAPRQTSGAVPTGTKERTTEELSLSDISVVDALPSFDDPPTSPRAPIANPSSDDNLPTMRKRVAPRARPVPPPPGPLASSRGRPAPPGPASEPFPLSRGPQRGAPLR